MERGKEIQSENNNGPSSNIKVNFNSVFLGPSFKINVLQYVELVW